jgi:uncharacterized membrane protein
LKPLDRARIEQAIREAEAGTTGHIWVRFVPDLELDALEKAKAEFVRRRLHQQDPRNTALVLIAPEAHKFAVIGDHDLNERVGDAFWNELVEEMRPHFVDRGVEHAVCVAVERIGRQLHAHFPANA